MSNILKRLIHRRQDKKEVKVFTNIITDTCSIVQNIERLLSDANYEEPQLDDLIIMLNNQLHENLRLYINHKFSKPSHILSAEEILKKTEVLHDSVMGFKKVTSNFVADLPFNVSSIYALPPEVRGDILKPYGETIKKFALGLCNLSHKTFMLLTYDFARLRNNVDIIDEYYRSTSNPKIKISINKEEILKQVKQSDSSKSDNITNNVQKGREK